MQKRYPEDFYYIQTQVDPVYNDSPPGQLDIERLIQGQPCWYQPGLSGQKHFKTLIIACWESITRHDLILEQLIKDNFSVYYYRGPNVIESVTLDGLKKKSYSAYPYPLENYLPEIVISTVVEQLRLSKDQVHIINPYWLDFLENIVTRRVPANKIPCHYLDISEITPYLNTPQEKHLRQLLQQSSPPLEQIYIDKWDKNLMNWPAWQNIKYISGITDLAIDDPDTLGFFNNPTGFWQPHIAYSSQDFITKLTVKNCSWHDIRELLQKHLNSIRFLDITTIDDINFSEDCCPIRLKALIIEKAKQPQSLANFSGLLSSKTVNYIAFFNMHDKGTILTNSIDLPKLNRFIYKGTLSHTNLKSILAKTNCLKSLFLDISNQRIIDALPENLAKLEHLELGRNCPVSLNDIQTILTRAPNLKQITIKSVSFTKNVNITMAIPASVEELTISELFFFHPRASQLLQNNTLKQLTILTAPVIDYMNDSISEDVLYDISSAQIYNAHKLTLLTQDFCFDSLEELHFNFTGVSLITLNQAIELVNTVPSIKFLSLSDPGNRSFPKNFNLGLECLNVLNLPNWISSSCIDFLNKLILNVTYSKLDVSTCSKRLIAALQSELDTVNITATIIYPDRISTPSGYFKQSKPLQLSNQQSNTKPTLSQKPKANRTALAKEWIMDADTKFTQSKTVVQRIFSACDRKDISPIRYRLNTFDHLAICQEQVSINQAFKLSHSQPFNLQKVLIKPVDNLYEVINQSKSTRKINYFKGTQAFELTQEWQPIASLAPNEQLTHYKIHPANIVVEISYCANDNFYLIRHNQSNAVISIVLEFLIAVPKQTFHLPTKIQTLVEAFNNYQANSLKIKANFTGEDYLQAIIKQKTGTCRHRAIAFKAIIDKNFSYPSRIVLNDCHAFVEIKVNKAWLRCDLGGYPTDLIETVAPVANLPSNSKTAITDLSVIEPMNQASPMNRPAYSSTNNPTKSVDKRKYYEQALSHNNHFTTVNSLDDYCDQIINHSNLHNRLITVTSADELTALQESIYAYCHTTLCPVYYVHTPKELQCASPFLKVTGNLGAIQPGPGGKLYDFIKTSYSQSVLLINFDNFKAEDLVRYNTILDKKPSIDGVKLPKSTLVIGLLNVNKPDLYQGGDFHSRFDKVERCPLQLKLTTLNLKEPTDSTNLVIDIHHNSDWREQLLGRWQLHHTHLAFQPGLLAQALKQKQSFCIANGLWNDPDFNHFWRQAYLQGFIETPVGQLAFDRQTIIYTKEGYDWSSYAFIIKKWQNNLAANAIVMNRYYLHELFHQYEYDETNHRLISKPGVIQEYSNKRLTINVTESLDSDQWAKLLQACVNNKTQLTVHTPADLVIPSFLKSILPAENFDQVPTVTKTFSKQTYLVNQDYLVIADDKKVVLECLSNQAIVLDISEVEPYQLLSHTKGELDLKSLGLHFSKTLGIVTKTLADNGIIALTGKFSNALIQALASLWLARQNTANCPGQLIIITDCQQTFPYINVYHQLQKNKPSSLNNKSTHSMAKIPLKQRLQAINAVLEKLPFIVILGETGIGKSTAIEKEIPKTAQLYVGESQLLNWALDKSERQKILFIDEANIGRRHWSEFETLFNKPPGILVGQEYIILTPDHKIIFVANRYKNERTWPCLWDNHPETQIEFAALPIDYINQTILTPLFKNTVLERSYTLIVQLLSSFYDFMLACTSGTVLMTPREFETISLLLLANCSYFDSVEKALKFYIYQLGQTLVPKNFRLAFEQQFKSDENRPLSDKPTDFLITLSRQPLWKQLSDLLILQQFRKHNAVNDVQRYGGLGGIIIEGNPGIGKSEIVYALLLAKGYQEISLEQINNVGQEKVFYRLPASLNPNEKVQTLLALHNNGILTLMDEINASPHMERLLNALLMGKDLQGNRPSKTGFFIIATQNPPTMSGRRHESNALSRRFIKYRLKDYSIEEMQAIIHHDYPKLSRDTVNQMIESYNKVAQIKNDLSFRNLLLMAHKENQRNDDLSLVNTAEDSFAAYTLNNEEHEESTDFIADNNIRPTANQTLTKAQFNQAIDNYISYKNTRFFGLSWMRSSKASKTCYDQIAATFSDADLSRNNDYYRFTLAHSFITQANQSKKRQFAKELANVLNPLSG